MTEKLHALVLAGDRKSPDPVAVAAGTTCKALAPVGGKPMLLRVLETLANCRQIGAIQLCGPPGATLDDSPELKRQIDGHKVRWIEPAGSPTRSVEAGLAQIDGRTPVLITTADHALLSVDIAGFFAEESLKSGADATVGLVRHSLLKLAIPASRRTVLRFRDDNYCTSNLFCLMTPASRELVALWRGVEQQRKKPWRVMAGLLGPIGVLTYVLGLLTLPTALERLSRRLNLRIVAVELPFPLAAVDVDTAEDLELVRSLLNPTQTSSPPPEYRSENRSPPSADR